MDLIIPPPDRSKMRLCCHHGDYDNQNNLAAAKKIMEENPQIDIYEIDFVDYGRQFISSHDYAYHSRIGGSPLSEWIREICVKRKKILYVDLKVDVDFSYLFFCSGGGIEWKFDCQRLYAVLNEMARKYRKKYNINIRNYIWLTSQDYDVVSKLNSINEFQEKKRRWTCIIDVPYVNYYIAQYTLPGCMMGLLGGRTYSEFMTYNFDCDIVALDYSFFTHYITRFIENSTIKLGSTIILYSFELGTEPINIMGYNIVMTYNYRKKKKAV